MRLSGWGKTNSVNCKVYYPRNIKELKSSINHNVIARGLGRSYGDSSIQPNGTIITTNLNKILEFNKKKGLINVESGISLNQILKFIVPKGWFLPVTPGTKFVTIGGMISSDSHGKNHHKVGSFKNHIISLKLLTYNKKIIQCSTKKNKKIFNYTCGGMGLAGIILSCKFKLIPIETSFIFQEKLKARNLDDVFNMFYQSNNWDYTVAWIDTSSRNNAFGRSIFLRGRHAKKSELDINKKKIFLSTFKEKKLAIPFLFPKWLLNTFTIKLLNIIYYNLNTVSKKIIHFDKYFYHLDSIKKWNLLYGKNGFTSYQCVFPLKNSQTAIKKILYSIHKLKMYSFVSVLKLLGKNDGLLSFGLKGFTIVLDFPINKKNNVLFNSFDKIVKKYKGKIYLTKDNRASKNFLASTDSNFVKFSKSKFRKKTKYFFNSLQSKKLGL